MLITQRLLQTRIKLPARVYLIIIPPARMSSESIAHSVFAWAIDS